jgi:hypothetical protein
MSYVAMQFLEILWLGVVEVGHYQVRAQGFEKIRIQDPVQNITEHLEQQQALHEASPHHRKYR